MSQFSNTAIVPASQLQQGLARTSQYLQEISGDKYLKLHQDNSNTAEPGSLTFGGDHEMVHPDSEWVVNTYGLEHGYLIRNGINVDDKHFVSFLEPVPKLPRGTKPAFKIIMKCISTHHLGAQVEFSGDSAYIKNFFISLVNMAKGRASNPNQKDKLFPVVRLESDSYFNRNYGKTIYTVKAYVQRWTDQNLTGEKYQEEQADPGATARPRKSA